MATTKATHKGTCQICGYQQKLPARRLSRHGYTVRCGFLQGTCFGAGHLPFEQDVSLIEAIIAQVQAQADDLRKQAAEVRRRDDPADVMVHAYFSMISRYGSGYRWIKADLSRDQYGRPAFTHPGDDRKRGPHLHQIASSDRYDLPGVARESNGRYADHLEKQAAEMDRYVDWQRGRIRDWQPTDLIPIEATAAR